LSYEIIEKDLSAEALGVLVYVLSRPDNWQIYPSQLAKKFHCGRDKMTRILKEIRKAGYARFNQLRDSSGHLVGAEWIFSEIPQADNKDAVKSPKPDLPDADNQDAAETYTTQPTAENPTAVTENSLPHPEKPQPVKPHPVNPQLLITNKQLSTENKLITDKFSADDFALAEQIFSKIKQSAPKVKSPDFKKWAGDVRLMREQDDLTLPEIWETFLWANCDSFWSANILSTKKLRAKFAQLDAQRRRNHGYQQPNQPSDRPRSGADRLRAIVAQQERDDSLVGEDAGDLRPQVGRVVRDDAQPRLDLSPQGDFT